MAKSDITFVPDATMFALLDNPVWIDRVRSTTNEVGRYNVRYTFKYGTALLRSYRTVTANTRQDAVASVEGGQDAEVLEWSRNGPEIVWSRTELGI